MTRRTVLRETFSSRAISLIERPSTKCSRRILPTVSTRSTPFAPANAREITGVKFGREKRPQGGQYCKRIHSYTKLIVTARQYALLEETFEIARALQPAMIVLEDIDLVGGHRDGPFAARGAMLNLLLNEMDGLAPEARMLFVLRKV